METKFTRADLHKAVRDLSTIPFFPTAAADTVLEQLEKMCPHYRALRFVVDTAVERWKKWESPAELRAILCARFDSADGYDPGPGSCITQGLTAAEMEQRAIEQNSQFLLNGRNHDAKALAALESPQFEATKGQLHAVTAKS